MFRKISGGIAGKSDLQWRKNFGERKAAFLRIIPKALAKSIFWLSSKIYFFRFRSCVAFLFSNGRINADIYKVNLSLRSWNYVCWNNVLFLFHSYHVAVDIFQMNTSTFISASIFFVLFATGHKVFLGQFWVRVWLAFLKRWEVGEKEFLLERCSLGLSQPTALCVSYVGLTYTGAASIASRVEPPYEPP